MRRDAQSCDGRDKEADAVKALVIASDKAELASFHDDFIKVVCGVGPILAAASAASAIAQYRPDAVFSVGSAGSLGVLRIGDCVSFGSVITPDHDLTAFRMKRGSTLLPSRATLHGITLDRSSSYVLSSSGTFASSCPPLEADAADMEAYGIAVAAMTASIPCFAVKVITDVVGEKVSLPEYGYTLRSLRALLPERVAGILERL